jgi:hypothetical protein
MFEADAVQLRCHGIFFEALTVFQRKSFSTLNLFKNNVDVISKCSRRQMMGRAKKLPE